MLLEPRLFACGGVVTHSGSCQKHNNRFFFSKVTLFLLFVLVQVWRIESFGTKQIIRFREWIPGIKKTSQSPSSGFTERNRFSRLSGLFNRRNQTKTEEKVELTNKSNDSSVEDMDLDSLSSSTSHSSSSGQFARMAGESKARSHNRRRIQRMIEALSFEVLAFERKGHLRIHKGKKSSSKGVFLSCETAPATASYCSDKIAESDSSGTLSDTSSVLSQLVVQVLPKQIIENDSGVIKATLSRDETDDVEVIFYDALQVGDGKNEDEFDSQGPTWDSVILENVLAVTPGGGGSGEYIEVTRNGVGLALPPLPIPNLVRDPTWVEPIPPPPPPKQLPLRFLRAGKGDSVEGVRRYNATLTWRRENKVDGILREPNPHFEIIKKNYPHFCHGRGYNGEPCYYEQPPKTDLKAMRKGGVGLETLLRHYTMVTEFQWQYLERDDLQRSIYIIDLDGMGFADFAGEVVDFVKKASALSSQHYPERAGVVFVINVPGWFKMIWNIVKPWVDEVTLKKIFILRDKEEIRRSMEEKIPPENLPREYGGKSPYPLGQSPEEVTFANLVAHNNRIAQGDYSCGGAGLDSSCPFCTWVPPRSY